MSHSLELTLIEHSLWDVLTTNSSDICEYILYASLDHLPRICIEESAIPAVAAADAPPIRNECVFMFDDVMAARSNDAIWQRVK